ncbi:hypothetical protein [Motilimonas pumila]|uniref:Uncharacterized protein n=1 Tax=Motilimonas pumila TaxID=2303987 RepID=A0A418YE90_9GAMM|nr:hypothetical protein [Motilimonas pumila]RJG47450.1 hypothetical protein D1Z90_11095 [Motilimonas pumila]
MKTYLFLVSEDKVLIHLDPNSDTLLAEKEQLVSQGFEVLDYIAAENLEAAYEMAKQPNLHAVEQYTQSNFFCYIVDALVSLLRGLRYS